MKSRLTIHFESSAHGLTRTIASVDGLRGLGVVGFEGVYANERSDHDQASWMIGTVGIVASIQPVWLLILDLRAFEYKMGNHVLNIWGIFQEGQFSEYETTTVPVWTVTGPGCDRGIRTLLEFGGLSTEHVYGNLESALAAAKATKSDLIDLRQRYDDLYE